MGFYQDHCVYLPAMLGWFLFSALLSSYNKLVFGQGHLHFPCPLLLTSIHFLIQWLVSYTLCELYPKTLGGDAVKQMDWRAFLGISLPCGLVTSGDVGLSNLSLVHISITFYTMVKASTPIFVLGWAYLLGIERITWSLLGVVFIIAAGEFLTVAGEVEFDLIGFIFCLTASFLSGARWTLVQLKLHTLEPPLKSTLATMRVLSPSMFASMLFFSLCAERPWIALSSGYFENAGQAFHTFGLGIVGAFFAIAMILCEFHLIMRASAIVLMIGGVIKEMITIIIGVRFFHDDLNRINEAGCAVVFIGVILYKISHYLSRSEKEEDDNGEIHKEEYRPVESNLTDYDDDQEDPDQEDPGFLESSPIELKSLERNVVDEKDDQVPSDGEKIDASVRHRIV